MTGPGAAYPPGAGDRRDRQRGKGREGSRRRGGVVSHGGVVIAVVMVAIVWWFVVVVIQYVQYARMVGVGILCVNASASAHVLIQLLVNE